jgi:hypothetical protein
MRVPVATASIRGRRPAPRKGGGAWSIRATRGALTALAVAGALAPAGAEVTVSSSASLFADVATDGQFDSPTPISLFDEPNVNASLHAELPGGRADGTLQATINASPTSASATASGTTDIEHCCTEEDGEPNPQTGAGAGNGFDILICSDQRATFTLSVSGNVQANGDASTNVFATLCCDANGDSIDLEGEDSSLGPSMGGGLSGVLNANGATSTSRGGRGDGGGGSPSCASIAVGASSSLDTGQPTSVTQWSASVSVVETPEPPDAEEFLWVGGVSGTFTEPGNWSPAGGPPDASDTALFTQGSQATVDLASAALSAAALDARGPQPVERLLERTRVNLDPLRPDAGVLRLLSPALDDPSLVVNSGGRLLVDNGSVAAQSAIVGQDGLGTVEVTGPNLFQTDGLLVLGKDGEGRLNVSGGGNALTNEVVMGEGSEPGNAIVAGQGSLWVASKLLVSKNEPSTVQVFAGGELDTTEAVVDRAPQGELPNVTVDQGARWLVDRLRIDGRGVVECTGGRIEPRDPNATGELAVGSILAPGTARLLASEGCRIETTGDLVVGHGGDGRLTIDSSNQQTSVVVGGTLRAGVQLIDLGDVTVLSNITSQTTNVLAGALEYLGGRFRLRHAGRVAVTGAASIGRTAGALTQIADVDVLGNGPPSLTRLELGGATRIGETGRLDVRDATLVVGGTFDIDPGGVLRGIGSENVVDALNGILNNGTLVAPLRLASGTNVLSQSTGTWEGTQASGGAPQLNPLSASAFARALRRVEPPPPPAQGPFAFEGDGNLAGTLVVQFRNGVAPRQGDELEVVTAAGELTGSFADVQIRGLAPGAQFDTTAAGGALRVVALNDAVALPTVSMTAKPKLKEKKKAGAKVKLVRDGDVSAPLLVSYAVGGTATNGVDYELLPGTIEIPAGKRSAKLVIRPRRDGLVEDPETVELTLLPGTDYTPSLFSEVAIELTSADRLVEGKKRRR